MAFPIEAVRQQFPSLATTDDGQRRIYFDNAAGTQVPRHSIDRIVDFFHRYNSNTGVFNPTSVEVDALYDSPGGGASWESAAAAGTSCADGACAAGRSFTHAQPCASTQ